MKKDNLPTCSSSASIKDIIHTITDGKCGLVIVAQDQNIQGIITDGDIRRAMETQEDKFFSLDASDLMSKNPKTIDQSQKLVVASDMMTGSKINSLIVVDDEGRLAGIVQMYDLGI
jgi:arabinose-5-phosphate isomerase